MWASVLLPRVNLGEGNAVLEEKSELYFGQTDFKTFTKHPCGASRKLRGEVWAREKKTQELLIIEAE